MYQNGGPGSLFCGGYGAGGYGMMGPGMGGGMIFFWVIIIIGIALLAGRMAGGSDARHRVGLGGKPDALEILKRRYAQGEIEKAEFMAKRQDLGH